MLASIDVRMLLVLEALLEHRNVTHAARHLDLSQPSVSRALTRLRLIFNDDLLVRGSRGMVPTPHAECLAQMLPMVLNSIRGMVNCGVAQGKSRSTVRIAMPDHQAIVLLPPLLPLLHERASDLDIVTDSDLTGAVRRLEQGEIDLAIGQIGSAPQSYFRRRLYPDHFACLLRSDHPVLAQDWTIDTFTALRHAAVASDAKDGFDRVQDELAKLGVRDRDPVLVSNILTAALAIMATDLVLVVPCRVATKVAALLPLAIVDPPVDLSPYEVALIWHERCHRDPDHRWLRHEIAAAAAEQSQQQARGQSINEASRL
ncbi:LysR family transcriptional regulator [Ensifer sp. WSM1721]|uniref:LysR family transcriptional regulator n=1 Tax=Ensifer sp. WSM1721 TaxID=1041159 RepID=UPI0009FE1034